MSYIKLSFILQCKNSKYRLVFEFDLYGLNLDRFQLFETLMLFRWHVNKIFKTTVVNFLKYRSISFTEKMQCLPKEYP